MNRRDFVSILCLASATALPNFAIAEANVGDVAKEPKWIERLSSASHTDQQAAVAEAETERAAAVRAVKSSLALPDVPENRPRIAGGMRIARVLRIGEVVNALLDKIEFGEMGVMPATRPLNPTTDYLAVAALLAIGQPAISPTIEHVRTDDDEFHRKLYVVVLNEVLGFKLAKVALEDAVEKTKSNPADLQRTQAALKHLVLSFAPLRS